MFPWDSSVSAEVVDDNAEEMLTIDYDYCEINQNITIKLPMTVEGLKACKELSGDDIATNVTLVFSTAQAILAAKAGASYVSPFVGRLNDNSFSGVELIRAISQTFQMHSVQTEILAASLRDVHHVSRCFMYGADVCTLPPKVFWKMYDHVLTVDGLARFDADWKEVMSK